MNCKLKRKDLVLIKWNSKYMTDREGCSLSEDDKAIVLASSIYGINIPDSLCKDCMVIPKAYIKDIIFLTTT